MATERAGAAAIRRVVAAYARAVGSMDCAAFVAVFAEDALTFDPDTASPVQGHGELRAFFGTLCSHFRALDEVQDATFLAHDGAAVKWTCHGVLTDGRPLVFEGIDVFEVNDEGRIQTLWTYRDPLPFPLGAATD